MGDGTMQHRQPCIGDLYNTRAGEAIEVIGLGTGGIVIEYADGRAELVDNIRWQQLNPSVIPGTAQDEARPLLAAN